MTAVHIDLAERPTSGHGSACRCMPCGVVTLLLAAGRWSDAVEEAFAARIIDATDIEIAFAVGVDVLHLAGFRGDSR